MYILSKAIKNIFSNTLPPEEDFQDAFAGILEVLITWVTNMGKARVMSQGQVIAITVK